MDFALHLRLVCDDTGPIQLVGYVWRAGQVQPVVPAWPAGFVQPAGFVRIAKIMGFAGNRLPEGFKGEDISGDY